MLPPSGLALAPALDAADAKEAWALGLANVRRAPSPGGLGYHLFWVRDRTVGAVALSAREGEYAVIGRHTHCDAVLPEDPEISLRHLLARVLTLDDGVVLRLLELHASLPIFTESGEPTRSLVVSGPVMLRLGRYVIGAVPFGGSEDEELAARSPSSPPPASLVRSEVVPRSASRPHRITHITLLPAVSELGVRRPEAAAPDAPVAPGHARLTLARAGHSVSVELSEQELQLGVIVGRSHRCVDRGLRSVLTESVSRAHLLLLRERDATWAYDLGSVQGTWLEGKRVRRVRLRDGGTSLVLAEIDPVTLDWIAG